MPCNDGGRGERPALNPRVRRCLGAAISAHQRFRSSGGRLRPPVPIEEMIAREGYRIVRLAGAEDGVAGMVSLRDRIIAVNARHHRHRQRFSLAHELAHILLGHPPEVRCSPEARAVFNREADLCASFILMPPDLLERAEASAAGPQAMALLFDVSQEALSRRLLDRPETIGLRA